MLFCAEADLFWVTFSPYFIWYDCFVAFIDVVTDGLSDEVVRDGVAVEVVF